MESRTIVESMASGALARATIGPEGKEAAVRVLAVIPGNDGGANFIFARRQVQSLVAMGLLVQTFYLKSRTSPLVVFREWLRLRRLIAEFSPAVVHAHYGTVTSFLCIVATARPVVITFRGSDLNPVPGHGFLRTWISLLLSQISALRASAILCTCDRLRDRLWWRKKNVIVVPSGVDLRLFRPLRREEARSILGWRVAEKVVLFNSGKTPLLKGLPLAERAISVAEAKLGPLRFVKLDGDIPPEEMPLYLNAANCLVLASESEGSPNIVKEALACDLPVVSVDVGDVAARLDGVRPSRVVPRDASSLGQAICEVLMTPERSNGREKVLVCSDDKIAAIIRDVYGRVRRDQSPSHRRPPDHH
jgi:glycosyltransferase involved in cell wall biosynthesis